MKRMPGLSRWMWWFSLAAALILLYRVCGNLTQVWQVIQKVIGVLSPVIAAFALAFFLNAPVKWLEGCFLRLRGRVWQRLARPVAIAIVYLLLFGLLSLLVYLLIPHIVTGITGLIKAMPGYLESAKGRLEEFMRPGGPLEDLNLAERLDEVYTRLQEWGKTMLSADNILTALRGVVNVTTSLVDVVLTVILSVYMLSGREQLTKCFVKGIGLFVKEKHLTALRSYARRTGEIFYKYFYGAFLDAMVVGVVASIGLMIFKVPYGVALGMLLGLMNMVPYFGAVIGSVGISVVTLLSRNVYAAIGVAIYLIVVQQVDGNIIQPRIVGGSVGLRPVYVLLGVTLFGGLFGFWGVLLAVPLTAVVQMLFREKIQQKESGGRITVKPPASPK